MSHNPQTTNAAPAPVASTRAYLRGELVAEGFALDDVRKHLDSDRHTVVWVDLCSPDHGELTRLAEQLDFHELAVEDALGSHQRPKLDEYRGHQFLVLRPVWLDIVSGKLSESEVDAFVSERVMITIRKDARLAIEPVVAMLDGTSVLAANGVSYMLYGLIDHIVDDFLEVARTFGGIYDTIGDGLFDEKPLDRVEQEHWFQIRKSLLRFDQLVESTCEAVNALIDNDGDGVNGEMHPYFQDVRDHIIYVSECTEVLRVVGATIVDTNLAFRDYQQSLAMKKVTSWAGIIAVPTLITGYYGMNVPYPGESQQSGVVVSALLAVVTPVVLYVYFKRRGWL